MTKDTMTEQDYERLVRSLENDQAKGIASIALAAILQAERDGLDGYERTDFAHDEVFNALIEDTRWEAVEAADISDIAGEAAFAAQAERRQQRYEDEN